MTANVPNSETLQVTWVTSTYSGGGNNCLQAGSLHPGHLAVRDSKNPSGSALVIPAHSWGNFLAGIRGDQLGHI